MDKKIVDFSKPIPPINGGKGDKDVKRYFNRDETCVFWNLEDYPIPTADADVASIYPNMTSALHRMGFHGWFGIRAYSQEPNKLTKRQMFDWGIQCKPKLNEDSIVDDMSLDIINWIAVTHPGPKNIVVIAKQDPESEFHRILKCLKSRNHHVLLVDPTQGSLFESPDSIVNATQVLGGGKPISRKPRPPRYADDDDGDADADAAVEDAEDAYTCELTRNFYGIDYWLC